MTLKTKNVPYQKNYFGPKKIFCTSKGPPYNANKNWKIQQSQLSLFTTLFLLLNLQRYNVFKGKKRQKRNLVKFAIFALKKTNVHPLSQSWLMCRSPVAVIKKTRELTTSTHNIAHGNYQLAHCCSSKVLYLIATRQS